jgi:L-gulonate 5-dehydrogenase
MELAEVPEPGEPGPGEVVIRPEAVGICGSDLHIFLGELGPLFPRVQGHELSGVVEAVGPECQGIHEGGRVAVWPVMACGRCYPCTIGRESACASLRLVGVHADGGLQARVRLPAAQVFPVGDQDPAVAALIEPISIGVRTVSRGRVSAGERVVVLGAGPIGQSVSLVARERGASVLLVDRLAGRLEHSGAMGVDTLVSDGSVDVVAHAREWSGGEGPPVVIDATGSPQALRDAVEMVAFAGRVVVAGISDKEVPLPMGSFVFKELDVVGTSCCSADEFAEAVRIVARNRAPVERLITHEFPLERAPEAIAYTLEHQAEVMKAVIRL